MDQGYKALKKSTTIYVESDIKTKRFYHLQNNKEHDYMYTLGKKQWAGQRNLQDTAS